MLKRILIVGFGASAVSANPYKWVRKAIKAELAKAEVDKEGTN